MPVVQFRGLAAKGVLRDPSPYQLELDAFSGGANMRFHANRAERAPAFKIFQDALPAVPSFAAPQRPSTNADTILTITDQGTISNVVGGVIEPVTPVYSLIPTVTAGGSGYLEDAPPEVTVSAPAAGGKRATVTASVNAAGAVIDLLVIDSGTGYAAGEAITLTIPAPPSTATTPVQAAGKLLWRPWTTGSSLLACTSTALGDVTYLNRPDLMPVYYGQSSTVCATLPGWSPTWTCRSLRAYGDYLIALNVTKGAQALPNLVKWSTIAFAGQPPTSWNADDATTVAGENPLEQLRSALVDGVPLRSVFVLYSEDQIWSMAQNEGQSIFNFTRLFGDGGLFAPNCAVEVDGVHYCFGPSDIYQHDGVTKASLVDQKNRDYIYNNLDPRATERFFTVYVPRYHSVYFCYSDTSGDAAYPAATYPNRAAVYDISASTWSFIDLPYCSSGFTVNISGGITFASTAAAVPIATFPGTGASNDAAQDDTAVFSSAVGGPINASRLLAYDFANKGLQQQLTISAECNPPAVLERTGIDLDEQGSDLTTYKKVRRIFPLMSASGSVQATIQIGSAIVPDGPVTWSAPLSFDPTVQYKLDLIKGGRYLGYRVTVPGTVDFAVAGFDLDIVSGGRR